MRNIMLYENIMKRLLCFFAIKVNIKRDIIAGLSVSFVLIPQSMAYAQLAGLPVYIWLYSSFVPVIIASIFWYSQKMITCSITIVSLVTATTLINFADTWTEKYILLASLLAILSWLFYIILWYLKLGVLINFLSHPVTIGFTNAAAVLTITSQLAKIFWVSSWIGTNYLSQTYNLGINILFQTHFPTMLCGIGSLLFLIIWRTLFSKRTPIILILLILTMSFSYLLWYNENFWWKIVWHIPSWLPSIQVGELYNTVKSLSYWELYKLMIYAIIISMIWFAQTIWVAKYLSYKSQKKLQPNKELISQWIANISSGIFWWYNVAWSLSRSALNIRSWAYSSFSWIVAWSVVWITILFFTQFLYFLPIASLGAIIIIAVYEMIQLSPFIQAWKIEKLDAVLWIITFIVCIIATPNLEIWIVTWIILSLFFFIFRSMKPKIVEIWYYKDGTYRDIDLFWLKSSKHIGVYRFDGNLYFANSWHFESSILNFIAEKKKIKYVILDFEWVNNIDTTAEKVIVSLTRQLQESGIKVIITGVRTRVFEKLILSRFIKNFWDKYFYTNISEAIEMIEEKHWNEIDTKPLRKYKKDRNKLPELEKNIIKKIEKIS